MPGVHRSVCDVLKRHARRPEHGGAAPLHSPRSPPVSGTDGRVSVVRLSLLYRGVPFPFARMGFIESRLLQRHVRQDQGTGLPSAWERARFSFGDRPAAYIMYSQTPTRQRSIRVLVTGSTSAAPLRPCRFLRLARRASVPSVPRRAPRSGENRILRQFQDWNSRSINA